MRFKSTINLSIIFFLGFCISGFAQNIQVGIPVLEEVIRRHQLLGEVDSSYSFLARPIDSRQLKFGSLDLGREDIYVDVLAKSNDSTSSHRKGFEFRLMPLVSSLQISTGYPYPTASNFIPSLGFQTYLTTGFFASLGPLSIQIQPEFLTAQNKDYNPGILKSDNTEFLERFGQKSYTSFYPGQSSLRLNFGAFSFGASTENIWWGPGQFNSLLFSNNAFGFQHLTFNTRRPAKTFLGSFEGQLIMGYLDSSDFANLNSTIENTERRYLNGLTISYQPKWIPGLFLGLSRVFQQFQSAREDSFSGYFPVVEGLQKKQFFSGPSNSGEFDREGRDQQISVSSRYLFQNARAEIYFEYGRRDHAFDWREAVLNPEHARAYLLGFSKLFPYKEGQFIQVRGEMLHQQESINIIVRYPGIAGSLNWAGHGVVRQGFTQYGQMIGPGVGPGSNIQTLETAWVNGFNKLGIRLERLNRHQDTFIKFFAPNTENRPWVDFSFTLLGNWHWNSFLLQSQVNLINSKNILWEPGPTGSKDFPDGKNLLSTQSQFTLIYLFKSPR